MGSVVASLCHVGTVAPRSHVQFQSFTYQSCLVCRDFQGLTPALPPPLLTPLPHLWAGGSPSRAPQARLRDCIVSHQ